MGSRTGSVAARRRPAAAIEITATRAKAEGDVATAEAFAEAARRRATQPHRDYDDYDDDADTGV
jgi:hypothetical protein